MTTEDFRELWATERRSMLERGRAFCAELRRQEEQIREILPALRAVFRTDAAGPSVNDNRKAH